MKIKALLFIGSMALLTGYAQPGFSADNDPAGSVVGTPAAGSKFSRIKVGMHYQEVMDLVGQSTDRKSYDTGKGWIPFNFGGADSSRTEYLYKGEGTLTFSSGGVANSSQKLIKITVNPQESGYVR